MVCCSEYSSKTARLLNLAEADRKLFLGVLKIHDIKINYQALAQFMTTDSVKPTALGIQNRMSKLKSMVKSSCVSLACSMD